jgi:integrase
VFSSRPKRPSKWKGRYTDRYFVFADRIGGWLDLDAVSKAFSALLRAEGFKSRGLSLHSLRHFVGTMGLAMGNDVRTVSDLLGHADPGVTLRVYGHAVAGTKERAVGSIGDALIQAKARRLAGQN